MSWALDSAPLRTASRTATIPATVASTSIVGRPSGSARPSSLASSDSSSCGANVPTRAIRSPSRWKPSGAVTVTSGTLPTMPTTGVG